MLSKNGPAMTNDSEELVNTLWQDLYTKGDDIQKMSVIQALPDLLQTDNNATINRIIPKIQQELPNSSSEFHLVTSKIFKLLIEMNLNLNLLRPVLQGIESKDPIISNAWIDTLLSVIQNLSESLLKSDVMPFASKMSQINRPVLFRVSSCKILGQIAIHPKFSSFEVKREVLPLVQSLCQDCLYEVRSAMCRELPNIAKGLANDATVKTSLLPCLVELSSDENMLVREAAVDAVALLIPYMESETIQNTAIPLVKRLCSQSNREGDQTFTSVAKIYGQLLTNLEKNLSHSDALWFLDFFKALSQRGLNMKAADLEIDPSMAVTCRDSCAFNLPAVTMFTKNQLEPELNKWYSIFKALASDPCYIVRKTIAGCIHQITRILSKECKFITNDIINLIRDDAEEVLDVLVPNIGATLELLAVNGVLSREHTSQCTLDVGRALLKCQVEVFRYYNWRRKMEFLEQLERLPICVSADFIHQHFTPLVLKLTVEARARPVRTQAAKTLLIFLRFSSKENHRKWIRENLINILCNSTSCYTRHIFINMCVEAMQIFSWKYFKEYFYLPLLGLGEDPVSTVRFCVVNLCPLLKQMLILPIDRNLQLKLENFMSKIEMMEKDKDVLASLKSKLKEMRTPLMNKQETLMEQRRKIEEEERISQGRISWNTLYGTNAAVPTRQAKEISPRTNVITVSKQSNISKRSNTSANSSEMSFLDQHFYIDAGVALPDAAETGAGLEEGVSRLTIDRPRGAKEESVSTISAQNTDLKNMSDDDLIELETSTTNITDDVKADIQKMVCKSKLPVEVVRKRNKRHSCVLGAERATAKDALRRRSLNVGAGDVSKIPVCFRAAKSGEQTNMRRSKSGSVQSVCGGSHGERVSSRLSSPKSPADSKKVHAGAKENLPVHDSIKGNVPSRCSKEKSPAKASGLPVLVRRSGSSQK
ncbi:hypothetical protein JTB14_002888 [Gonioctena quinquepunctata]|nr:hypothetical protein JTB14_002888 [Gonioctena quinquepunctata]